MGNSITGQHQAPENLPRTVSEAEAYAWSRSRFSVRRPDADADSAPSSTHASKWRQARCGTRPVRLTRCREFALVGKPARRPRARRNWTREVQILGTDERPLASCQEE